MVAPDAGGRNVFRKAEHAPQDGVGYRTDGGERAERPGVGQRDDGDPLIGNQRDRSVEVERDPVVADATVAACLAAEEAQAHAWYADRAGTSARTSRRASAASAPMSELYAMITGCDPRQLQFDLGLWTRNIIRDLIRREFGIAVILGGSGGHAAKADGLVDA
jgi:hypothetical protein